MKIPKIKTVVAWATIRETTEKAVRVVIPADRAGDVVKCLDEMCAAGEVDIHFSDDDESPVNFKREITQTRTSEDFRPICVHCSECDREDGLIFCTAFDEWRDMDYCNEFCTEHNENGTEE